MSDTIYRQEAIKALDNAWINGTSLLDANEAIKQLNDLPSADRPSGEWIHKPQIGWGESWICSICGEKTTSSIMGYPRYEYCPNCGAKMKGADDE